MQIMRAFGWVIVVLLAWTTAMAAAPFAGENPSFTIAEAKVTNEKVEDIDYATRKVTLKDESGKVRIVKVGNDIHNLKNLRIGDEVTIETLQTISAEVKPGSGDPMNIGVEGQTAPLPGEKPSGIRTIEGTLRTKIESIDYEKRTVTFKGRTGVMTTYKIGPDAKRFDEIRRGDMLWVEYSQTIKLTVK
jgi:NADPH-dependent 2,4-dienoyl-CoA reductase/sulfur reductase-like enzyme